jgi:hypothetical protein
MKNWCVPWWKRHDWSKWDVTTTAEVYEKRNPFAEAHVVGKSVIQERQCQRCGLRQYDRQLIRVVPES